MMDLIIKESFILNRPTISMKDAFDSRKQVPKYRKRWDVAKKVVIQNNGKAKKILTCGVGPDEYNRILSYLNAKQNWDTLQTSHEFTSVVKKSKIGNLNQ